MYRTLNAKVLAVATIGFFAYVDEATAQTAGGNNFSTIARNITESIEELPGLVTSVSYMIGMLMGVVGVMKIKDHVENPTQTPMKDGAIRLAAGGALFGLPIVFESMLNTIGTTGAGVEPAKLRRVEFNVF